ncbi:MAG: hypothetical protein U5L45_02300 [Saprospiraceae bacterium]|nr:hypothetical protein [Saprospiraceae bacterium]
MKIFKIAVIAALYIAVFGTIVVALWNWLMPNLFGLPMITFWQGLGLFVLCRILTGSFRIGTAFGGGNWGEKREMLNHWKNMSSDERDRMKQEWKSDWRDRCRDRRPIDFNRPETGEQKEPNKDTVSTPKPKEFI